MINLLPYLRTWSVLSFLMVMAGCMPKAPAPVMPSGHESEQSLPAQASSSQSSGVPDKEEQLKRSWTQFVDEFKSREPLHEAEYIAHGRGQSCRIQWKKIDLERTNSISDPITGVVELRWFGTDKSNNSFEFDYRFEFIPSGSGWKFNGGKFLRLDKGRERLTGTPESESIYSPPLSDKWKVLFEG